MALCRKIQFRRLIYYPIFSNPILQQSSFSNLLCKVLDPRPLLYPFLRNGYAEKCDLGRFLGVGSARYLCTPVVREYGANAGMGKWLRERRKTLKKKKDVIKFLKTFRFKKKQEYQRMTAEEKLLFRITKARRKQERLLVKLNQLEPKEKSETKHDPEILTPEEHFYFLRLGQKSKNYVPVGRRGIFQGVILNMHLHWKKHQTLKVKVKTFSKEEVRDIAVELTRLSGGIVLDIQDDDIIIMYRGKNYTQPPTEIMSPRCSLGRIKAFKKSEIIGALKALRRHISALEQRLELLRDQAENMSSVPEDQPTDADANANVLGCASDIQSKYANRMKELIAKTKGDFEIEDSELEPVMDSDSEEISIMDSDSEDLSDIFDTESDRENNDDNKEEQHLYLDEFDKFPLYNNEETKDFEDHLRQVSADSRKEKSQGKSDGLQDLDEVDRMVIRAASSLKKKQRR